MHHNCHLFSSLYLSEGRRGHKRRNKPRKNPHDLDDPRLQDLGFDLPAKKTSPGESAAVDIPERPRNGKGRGKPRKFMKVRHWEYRVIHLLRGLGWDDFEFSCSTVCPVLLGLMGIGQKWLCTVQLGKMGIPNQSQSNPGPGADGPPCKLIIFF